MDIEIPMSLKLFSVLSLQNKGPSFLKKCLLPPELKELFPKCKPGKCKIDDKYDHEICLYKLSKAKSKKTVYVAAGLGRLDYLRHSHESGIPLTRYATRWAANRGNMDCLRYLFDHGCSYSPEIIDTAIKRSDMECLVYLFENGCPFTIMSAYYAADSGNVSILKYVCENGGSVDVSVAVHAAECGNINCLRYLIDNGYPSGTRTIERAVESGSSECLEFLIEKGFSLSSDLLYRAVNFGKLSSLKLLHGRAKTTLMLTETAAARGYLDCLKYLCENGYPVDVGRILCYWKVDSDVKSYLLSLRR